MRRTAQPRPAHRPADTPASAVVAVLIALALIALGVISGRELLIVRHAFHAKPWLRDVLEWLGRLHWQPWLLPTAGAAVLLGLVLLAVALKPRNRRHIGTSGEPVLWLRPTDLARASTAAALRVDGVAHARTTARPRSVEVHVVTDRSAADISTTVSTEVTAALRDLANPPKVRIHVEPLTAPTPVGPQ